MLKYRSLLRRLWRRVPNRPDRITVHWVFDPNEPDERNKAAEDKKEEAPEAGNLGKPKLDPHLKPK